MTVLSAQPSALKGLAPWVPPAAGQPPAPGLWLREFRGDQDRTDARGRVSIYEEPRKGRTYTLGFDCAHGIVGRDLSVACVFDKSCQSEGEGRVRQVAEAAGHWGEECFDRIVYALLSYYNGAFVMGESQGGGLAVLRDLVDQYGHLWLYYDKSVGSIAAIPAHNARLGWNRGADDVTLTEFREAVRSRRVELRSVALLEQMARYKWKPRSRQAEKDERAGDDTLKAKLDGGGSPDLIMAAMYGWYAIGQVHLFDKPKPAFEPGTYGAMFGLDKKFPDLFKGTPATAGFVPSDRGRP